MESLILVWPGFAGNRKLNASPLLYATLIKNIEKMFNFVCGCMRARVLPHISPTLSLSLFSSISVSITYIKSNFSINFIGMKLLVKKSVQFSFG